MKNEIKAAEMEMEAAREKFVADGQAAVKKCLKAFLDAHPEVAKVRLRGWIPGFNDGDACLFTLGDPEIMLAPANGSMPDDDDDDDDEDGDFLGSWDLEYDAKKAGKPVPTDLIDDLKAIEGLVNSCEEAVETMFGSNFEAIVTRDGEIEVSDYDCGY